MSLVTEILNVPESSFSSLISLRPGTRTRGLWATPTGMPHRFRQRCERVVVKLYKGNGQTEGSREYQTYHHTDFHRLDALTSNPCVQQSLEADVWNRQQPYAVVEYVEGLELAPLVEMRGLDGLRLRRYLEDILLQVWIPLWDAGLRFKDAHPGNWICTAEGGLVLIDTEMMRKSLAEKLHRPEDWSTRDVHEAKGLSRLPGLLHKMCLACGQPAPSLAAVKQSIDELGIPAHFHRLGRTPDAAVPAREACLELIERLAGSRRGPLCIPADHISSTPPYDDTLRILAGEIAVPWQGEAVPEPREPIRCGLEVAWLREFHPGILEEIQTSARNAAGFPEGRRIAEDDRILVDCFPDAIRISASLHPPPPVPTVANLHPRFQWWIRNIPPSRNFHSALLSLRKQWFAHHAACLPV